ncbi:hypothetical protein SODALDRAFT_377307 [Sodiomyces alkalinus F11]|uniref:Uncharacterized protein n=1 Tax=Sodiomyces alkalinus (strain CBS 110278 / VKM F-3762 / F11) TaxID=1314773 RepID=A0A3N2Q4E5_SODAK|nr:hypothetical protein SODALDRAFT_377307 [Sodiomyces alkalinus F11]ROT41653.1 hypothetical protein SODALDRAFT_377307 [Sodiomyces alkalinus F11]
MFLPRLQKYPDCIVSSSFIAASRITPQNIKYQGTILGTLYLTLCPLPSFLLHISDVVSGFQCIPKLKRIWAISMKPLRFGWSPVQPNPAQQRNCSRHTDVMLDEVDSLQAPIPSPTELTRQADSGLSGYPYLLLPPVFILDFLIPPNAAWRPGLTSDIYNDSPHRLRNSLLPRLLEGEGISRPQNENSDQYWNIVEKSQRSPASPRALPPLHPPPPRVFLPLPVLPPLHAVGRTVVRPSPSSAFCVRCNIAWVIPLMSNGQQALMAGFRGPRSSRTPSWTIRARRPRGAAACCPYPSFFSAPMAYVLIPAFWKGELGSSGKIILQARHPRGSFLAWLNCPASFAWHGLRQQPVVVMKRKPVASYGPVVVGFFVPPIMNLAQREQALNPFLSLIVPGVRLTDSYTPPDEKYESNRGLRGPSNLVGVNRVSTTRLDAVFFSQNTNGLEQNPLSPTPLLFPSPRTNDHTQVRVNSMDTHHPWHHLHQCYARTRIDIPGPDAPNSRMNSPPPCP